VEGGGGGEFPAILVNPLYSQMSGLGPWFVMLQDDLFLLWTFAMQCMMKLLECLKVISGIDGFPL